MAMTLNEVRDDIADALARAIDARRSLDSVEANLQSVLLSGWLVDRPLPAQTPTEDQIVAALRADPAMAGRVIVEIAQAPQTDRQEIGMSASDRLGAGASTEARYLQSLAVALAAASYRG